MFVKSNCMGMRWRGQRTIIPYHAKLELLLIACEKEVEHTFRGSLLTMRLHGDMGIEMVQRAISLLATIPATFVHALNFFIPSSGALMLLGAGNRDKGVDL